MLRANDYRVSMGGKLKADYANMLKRYHDRDWDPQEEDNGLQFQWH